MQANLREKEEVITMEKAYKFVTLSLALLFLGASWAMLYLASRYLAISVQSHGVLDTRTLLDAGVGYFGLFSFGISSLAVIFAVKAGLKPNKKIFRLFKVTFFVSILFTVPMLFSVLLYLLS